MDKRKISGKGCQHLKGLSTPGVDRYILIEDTVKIGLCKIQIFLCFKQMFKSPKNIAFGKLVKRQIIDVDEDDDF